MDYDGYNRNGDGDDKCNDYDDDDDADNNDKKLKKLHQKSMCHLHSKNYHVAVFQSIKTWSGLWWL